MYYRYDPCTLLYYDGANVASNVCPVVPRFYW